MKIKYLAHSGFLVETAEHILVFDYFRGELILPDNGKTVVFFVSHIHDDHYNPVIYEHSGREDTYYVLSEEIGDFSDHAAVTRVCPDAEYDVGGTHIKTLRSTDCGVAYLVNADGETIYHAGDLHLWVWDGRSGLGNKLAEMRFRAEIEKLRGIVIDAAFLPLDPRQGADGTLGFDYTVRTLDIKYAFPMHFWGRPEYVEMFCKSPDAIPYRDRIVPLTKEGREVTLPTGESIGDK